MGRNRTATAVLELRGSTKHNAYRYRDRANEPIVTAPLPDPPRRLPRDVKAAWREMQSRGSLWLTSADQFLVHIAAFYVARYRNNECSSAETSLLIGVLSKLGFSPKERGALNLPTRST